MRASSPLYSSCMQPRVLGNMLKRGSAVPCAFIGADAFECKSLGEVSVATSIYVFKSLVLFADESTFCF